MRTLMTDIYWLAGLLEGEGSFRVQRDRDRRWFSPRVSLQMSDEDIVLKVATTLHHKATGPHGPYGVSRKPTWQVTVSGPKAIGVMMTMLPLMGERRSAKIRDVLAEWRTYNPRTRKVAAA